MSQLDDILEEVRKEGWNSGWNGDLNPLKDRVKELFLELIGEDAKFKSGGRDSDNLKNGRIRSRNDYKAELRQKVEEL